jgi:hypothetical protein
MPTRVTNARLGDDLLDAARRVLGLPADTPASQVIRAALERLTGNPGSAGAPRNRGGRPKGWKPGQPYRPKDDELTRT